MAAYETTDQTPSSLELAVQQEFAIPFSAQNWGFDMVRAGAAQSEQSLANLIDCGYLYKRIAHDATFPDLGAASFELRLYQNDDLSASALLQSLRKAAAMTAGSTSVAEMKETSMTTNSTGSPICSSVR